MQVGPGQSSSSGALRGSFPLIPLPVFSPETASESFRSGILRRVQGRASFLTTIGALCASLLLTVGASASPLPTVQPVVHFPTLAAGVTSSASQQITVTAQTGGTISAIQVLTQGIANADFRDIGGGTCATGQTYFAGQSCTVNVVLQPTYPGTHTGDILLLDSNGNRLATQDIDGSSRGPLGLIIPGLISTVAGNGAWIYRADGVPAVNAPIFLPMGVAVDAAGNLFLSDSSNNRIRRVDAATGLISTVAGTGEPGFSGDNGPAMAAAISAPSALALNGAGDLYFADSSNHVIRRIDSTTGIITTVAGIGAQQGYAGDNGLAVAALLNQPYGLALDNAQNLYIADTGNNVIRKLSLSTGIITPVAGASLAGYNGDNGPASAAHLSTPWGLSFAADGSLYVADLNNNVVRRISPAGIITTVVGTGVRGFAGDTSPATAALLNSPAAVTLDVAGNIYVADSGNNRIRKVNAITGNISTISGNNGDSASGDGGNADAASLYGPYSLLLDGPGNLYIGDLFHNRVRKISSNAASLFYPTMRVNRTSAPQPESFENDGNADLTLTTLSLDHDSAVDATTTTCFSGAVLTTTNACTLGVEFAPDTVGTAMTGALSLRSIAANTPGVITLTGDVLSVDPTSVTVASSANPAGLASAVTFTSHVSTTGTSVTGTIKYLDGAIVLGTSTLDASGTATLIVSNLTLGSHPITAAYSGDASNAASTSTVLLQIIKQPTSLALASSLNPSVVSASVTLTATLTGTTGTPSGNVTFTDGNSTLGIAALTAGGTATLTVTTFNPGTHLITGSYSGDPNNMNSKSPTLTQTVSQAATLTTISTSSASVTVGTTLTFTASVGTTQSGPMPGGSVAFNDGSITIGTGTLNSAGVATFSTSALAPAQHPITAAYLGDTNSITSTSTVLTQTITQITTSTTVISSANPANAGAPLTFTATVTAAGGSTAGGPVTGQVTFKDGASTLGAGTLSAGGVATFTTTSLAVNTHTITAVYAGSTNYATSASSSISQTIQQASSNTTLSSSLNPAIAGKTVTLTATVTTVGGPATGTVTFQDGATILGQSPLSAQGIATFTTSSLNVNNHTIVATYNADANNLTSSSTPLVQSIQIATTFLSLTGSPNPAIAGVAVTLTAGLTWNGAQPTGAIVFKDGATVLGTLPLNGSTPLSLTLSNLSVGSHAITANYAGDANDSPSVSQTLSQVVQQAATTTSLASNQNPIQLGQAITFSSNVANPSSSLVPTGIVTYFDGANTIALGTATVSSTGTASFTTSTLGLGNHTITAVYSGDANHSASTSAAITQRVLQATAIALTSSANPGIAGKNITFTAKLPGQPGTLPTGTVSFKDGSSVLGIGTIDATGTATFSTTSLVIGAHSITAFYAGDTNFQAITSTVLTQAIQIASTNIALVSDASPAIFGAQVNFTSTITGTGGAITGTVAFMDGTSVLGSATLNASGVAFFSINTLSPGVHSITASYAGDSNNQPNSSAVLQQQIRQVTQTALASGANPGLTLDPINLTATVTTATAQPATGSVTFTEGSSVLGIVALDSNGRAILSVPPAAAGTHSIIATYAGDVADIPSVSSTLNQVVLLRDTNTVLTATSTSVTDGQQVTLISVVRWTGPSTPTGTVIFKNGNTVVGISQVDKTGVAALTIILNTTTVNLVASYSGDTAYSPSATGSTAITSGPATQFSIGTSSSAIQLQSKQHTTIDVTLTSIKGFSDTLVLGCLGLPNAATCTFSADQAKLAADGAQTVHLVIDTGSPLTAGSVARAETKSSTTMLAFLPFGAILGIALYRSRRRVSFGGLLLVLCFLGLSLGATGCGSLNINGTPVGAYTFKITAAGMGTGVSQSKDITLTVTQ